jgi:hypothetical protein
VKLTKSKLKQMIKEELEEGLFDSWKQKEPINYVPTPADYPLNDAELQDAVNNREGQLQDKEKQAAIDNAVNLSDELINIFLKQATELTNIERHIATSKLIRHLSSVMVDGKTKEDLVRLQRENQIREK